MGGVKITRKNRKSCKSFQNNASNSFSTFLIPLNYLFMESNCFGDKEKYNLDMKTSISLGDKERDIEAAKKAGVGKNFLFNGCYREIIEKL